MNREPNPHIHESTQSELVNELRNKFKAWEWSNNLFFPYITRKNRGDTLSLARALYALNPSSIKTPITKRIIKLIKRRISNYFLITC